ncbi:hypothetical protein CWB41_10765 [Methylovirgula ligni]|nr:hypothetical protein CWB41_10765 [Methylovirgula ligni]
MACLLVLATSPVVSLRPRYSTAAPYREIIEQGTHDELVVHNGLYANLYKRNFSSFDEISA